MPNRIIKESICTSDNLNNLSADEERFFYRIIVCCDDYGRMEADPKILRAKCFPLKIDDIKNDKIVSWLKTLVKENLIKLYVVEGRTYLTLTTWDTHQQVRAKRSKYPDPDNGDMVLDINCNQMIADASNCPRNPIQSESNPNPNPIVVKEKDVFDHWNSVEGLTHHKVLTNDMKRAIESTLREYSADDLKKAITNYATIVSGPEYYFKYKWTLADFLSRRSHNNIERFLNLEVAKSNFKMDGKTNGTHQAGTQPAKKVYTPGPVYADLPEE